MPLKKYSVSNVNPCDIAKLIAGLLKSDGQLFDRHVLDTNLKT